MARPIGICIMLTAALLSNVVVANMAQVVNIQRPGQRKVQWEFKGDKAAREILRLYRANNPGGPLFKAFLASLAVFAIGTVIMFIK